MTDTVGVRELRQNLSKYLEFVKDGEDIVITERGVPIARIVGLGVSADAIAFAIKYNATIPKRRMADILDELEDDDIEPAPEGTTDAFLAESRKEWDR